MIENIPNISSYIAEAIKGVDFKTNLEEIGFVISVKDGIVISSGLDNAFYGELISFENGATGMAINLLNNSTGIVLFGNDSGVRENEKVFRTKKIVAVPVGKGLLGRVVDALGRPIDGKGEIKYESTSPIEVKAPGIIERKSVHEPLQTGIKSIDGLVPIGRGQRELIIGDRKTGKTAIAIDTILNPHKTNTKSYIVFMLLSGKSNPVLPLLLES